ncbi:uncharacterized protein PAC_14301 [Phialocephala subalpina]|uniref:Inosine/uridine-preferring nucleoside hydrolase domain-containing protein n=1 Tax=Phialocephala subalpina TaxID=576137 RepID=A0A1L7XH74_9HELO|nr:uncharacterized protein PAC_14301 [Phialocephala subalpina]
MSARIFSYEDANPAREAAEKAAAEGGPTNYLPSGLLAEECSIYDTLHGVLQQRTNVGEKAPKLVVITDLAKDYDDLAAMVVLKELHRLGLVELRGFVANLMPAHRRALFGRGALDSLGLQYVPIAIGLRASPNDHKELPYEFGCSFMPPEENKDSLENGNVLLRRLCDAAKEENEKLTFVLLSSLSDIFHFSEEYQDLQDVVSKVFLQGGYTVNPLLKPDFAAANNKFDPDAANGFHKFMYTHNIPSAVYTKIATINTPTLAKLFDDLGATGHPCGQHLSKVRLIQDEVFYDGACSPNPPFFDQRKFLHIKTTWFDTHAETDPLPEKGDFEAIRPYLTKVVVYDALPTLASAGADVLQALGIKAPSNDLHEIIGVAKTDSAPEVAGLDGVKMAKALGALMKGSLLASVQGL